MAQMRGIVEPAHPRVRNLNSALLHRAGLVRCSFRTVSTWRCVCEAGAHSGVLLRPGPGLLRVSKIKERAGVMT